MDETLMLIILVAVMLVGSYLAGNIPLVMNLSEEKLRMVTIMGAGLLVGTALTVIIPEGIRSLYSDTHSHDHHTKSTIPGEPSTEPESNEMSSTIGFSLVLGFVFMLVVDQISSRHSGGPQNEKSITATIGLVVHAAADGVALGAAATTSHQDVEIIVFLAIMLHKAPAAFGLVSFLLHEGMDRQKIRKHLLIFSLSAPLLTLLTFFGIGQEQKETLNQVNATGIAMLFSAGTFLYVATVHVLPELTAHSHKPPASYSHLEQGTIKMQAPGTLKNSELVVLVAGALMPLLLTMGHSH